MVANVGRCPIGTWDLLPHARYRPARSRLARRFANCDGARVDDRAFRSRDDVGRTVVHGVWRFVRGVMANTETYGPYRTVRRRDRMNGCNACSITVVLSLRHLSCGPSSFIRRAESWANDLDQNDAEALLAAVRVLRDQGPNLGRPLVDTISGSRHKNMEELRPGSTGRSEVRVLFAFDRVRHGILLVGGDKCGDWSGWYDTNIPIADQRFDHHQMALTEQPTGKQAKDPKGKKGKRR